MNKYKRIREEAYEANMQLPKLGRHSKAHSTYDHHVHSPTHDEEFSLDPQAPLRASSIQTQPRSIRVDCRYVSPYPPQVAPIHLANQLSKQPMLDLATLVWPFATAAPPWGAFGRRTAKTGQHRIL